MPSNKPSATCCSSISPIHAAAFAPTPTPAFTIRLPDMRGTTTTSPIIRAFPTATVFSIRRIRKRIPPGNRYYTIFGTPRVFFNGTNGVSGGQVSASMLEDRIGQTSLLTIQVRETGNSNRQVEVEVFSVDNPPVGDLRLFVAVVEKEIQYNAPNGETLHHDVFRDMLTDKDGDPITLSAAGGSVVASFNFAVQSGWQENEVYVLAFVQDYSTKEVFNSGTRFDPVINSTGEELGGTMRLYPNPAMEEAVVEFPNVVTGVLVASVMASGKPS